MTDREKLEMRIEQLCEMRQGFVDVKVYADVAGELRTCKLLYNEMMAKVLKEDRPHDLKEVDGAYYRSKWVDTGGFGAVVR